MQYHLPPPIIRRAVSGSAVLGTLYSDDYGSFVGHTFLCGPIQSRNYAEPSQFLIFSGTTDRSLTPFHSFHTLDHSVSQVISDIIEKTKIRANVPYRKPFDQNTRVLYFSWREREELYPEQTLSTFNTNPLKWVPPRTTHLVTGIHYILDLIIVLPLSCDLDINAIDRELQETQHAGAQNNDDFPTLPLLEKLSDQGKWTLHVYSNIPSLNTMRYLSYLRAKVNQLKTEKYLMQPGAYALHSLDDLRRWSEQIHGYGPLSTEFCKKIEDHLDQLRYMLEQLQICHEQCVSQQYSRLSPQVIYSFQEPLHLKIEECQRFIKAIPKGPYSDQYQPRYIRKLEWMVDGDERKQWIDECYKFMQRLSEAFEQEHHHPPKAEAIVEKLLNDIRLECPEAASEPGLIKDVQHSVPPSSSEPVIPPPLLPDNEPPETKDESQNSRKRSREPSPDKDLPQTEPGPKRFEPDPPSETRPVHILLFGETGVGKSTFINALANYLLFPSLQDAEQGQPQVLIPVPFSITIGDDFHEKIVTYGEQECPKNEHFNNQGRSVTQHCQSYTFELPADERRRIRIIDTPGFGDTRGIEQDQLNIEHALDYIRHLSHVNAICFLLKPNQTRMNISFRTCLTQFFSLLPQHGHQSVIFCFTHSRCTFYTPGNTGSLLNQVLQTLNPSNDLKMEKRNTFCFDNFDNEASRYLVAKRSGIGFSPEEQEEYENSWKMSVKESYRLLNHIEALDPLKMSFFEDR